MNAQMLSQSFWIFSLSWVLNPEEHVEKRLRLKSVGSCVRVLKELGIILAHTLTQATERRHRLDRLLNIWRVRRLKKIHVQLHRGISRTGSRRARNKL